MIRKSNVCYMLDEKGREDVLDAVEQTATDCHLTKKEQLQLRLTAEELMCFLAALPGEYEASFWLEQKRGRFELHLTAALLMGKENAKKVLKAADQKSEDEVNGLVTRLSEFFVQNVALYVKTKLLHQKAAEIKMNRCMQDACYLGLGVTNWSLERYREAIGLFEHASEKISGETLKDTGKETANDTPEAQEQAHSILASLSDELHLCIHQASAELIAIKKNEQIF